MKEKDRRQSVDAEQAKEIFCEAVLVDKETLYIDPEILADYPVGTELKITIYWPDEDDPTS